MVDQQTKSQLQQHFSEIKPRLKQTFPQVEEQDLSKAQSDPDAFVQALTQRTNQPKEQIEQQLKQLVSSV